MFYKLISYSVFCGHMHKNTNWIWSCGSCFNYSTTINQWSYNLQSLCKLSSFHHYFINY